MESVLFSVNVARVYLTLFSPSLPLLTLRAATEVESSYGTVPYRTTVVPTVDSTDYYRSVRYSYYRDSVLETVGNSAHRHA